MDFSTLLLYNVIMKKLRYILISLVLIAMVVFCTSPQKHAEPSTPDYSAPSDTSDIISSDSPAVDETPFVFIARDVSLCGKSFSTANRKLDLNNITPNDVDAACDVFSEMPYLSYVEIGDESNGLTWSDLDRLYAAAPNAKFGFGFSLCGQELNTFDRILDFNHYGMNDEGEAVKRILPYMRNCTVLDMDSCGVSNEAMAAIRDAFPNIEVIWRIWFGYDYTVRTNVEKILASKPTVGGEIYDEDAQVLKYCTNLKFLDLGHNEHLSDFSFLSELKELRIAVLSITALHDLTPISNCSKLYYLEAGNTDLSDLSPLAKCTNLQHLNVGTCFDVSDISPLYDLNLKRLWLGRGDPVPAEQVAKMKELHPGIEIDTTCPTGFEGGGVGENEGFVMGKWKSYKQYLYNDYLIKDYTGAFPAQHPKGVFRVTYDAFEYGLNPACYSFTMYDPLVNEHESIYASTRGAAVDMQESPESGKVVYLTGDVENLDAWHSLAAVYTKETGIPVTVKAEETLDDAMIDIDQPTLFEINGSVDLMRYHDNCYDLSGSTVFGELTSDEYTADYNGETLGIARDLSSCYGILVNKPLLEQCGFSIDDIKDYESLKNVVASITSKRSETEDWSLPAAFVCAPMNDITETGLSTRLVNVPIVKELRESDTGIKPILDGTYLDQFHTFWDLYIYNMACSYYDISPAAYIQRTNEDSCYEWLGGSAVFFICGDEIWDYIQKDGRISKEDIGFIPLYMGYEDENKQGYCSGTDCYWSVNKNASESDIKATLNFMNWLVTSPEGTDALAEMGYNIPYKNAKDSDNPFIMADREATASGKIPITWNYAAQPSESWRDEVNYEMAAYSANLGDWSDIFGEIITVWTAEYAIK